MEEECRSTVPQVHLAALRKDSLEVQHQFSKVIRFKIKHDDGAAFGSWKPHAAGKSALWLETYTHTESIILKHL